MNFTAHKSKGAFAVACLCLAASSPCSASSPQESLNKVYEAPGTATEIAKRAQACIAKHLRNDSVQLNDAATESPLFRQPGPKQAGTAAGGQVITFADMEGGMLVATHRAPFRSWGMASVAQGVLTLNTKDGRFKLETTDIKAAQLSTGSIANAGFVDYRESSGAFKAAVAALGKAQEQVVACIKDTSANDW